MKLNFSEFDVIHRLNVFCVYTGFIDDIARQDLLMKCMMDYFGV